MGELTGEGPLAEKCRRSDGDDEHMIDDRLASATQRLHSAGRLAPACRRLALRGSAQSSWRDDVSHMRL
jgi:hypothetical protein